MVSAIGSLSGFALHAATAAPCWRRGAALREARRRFDGETGRFGGPRGLA